MDAAALANGHWLGAATASLTLTLDVLEVKLYFGDYWVLGMYLFFPDELRCTRRFASASQGATARSGWATVVPWYVSG